MIFRKLTQIIVVSLMLNSLLIPFISMSALAGSTWQGSNCAQDYVVQSGDWLSKLAEKQYGDALAFPLIVEATYAARSGDDSYANISDPNFLEVGWKVCLVNSDSVEANTEMMSDSGPIDLEGQVRAASATWDEAFNAENIEQLMELYTENAVSMPPGFSALAGKDTIRSDFEDIFANFDFQHQTTIVGLLISGNTAVERGDYTLAEGGETIEEGKHIVVREKDGNSWKVVWEIWNTPQ